MIEYNVDVRKMNSMKMVCVIDIVLKVVLNVMMVILALSVIWRLIGSFTIMFATKILAPIPIHIRISVIQIQKLGAKSVMHQKNLIHA
jgi:hypothetical protein